MVTTYIPPDVSYRRSNHVTPQSHSFMRNQMIQKNSFEIEEFCLSIQITEITDLI